MGAHSGHHRDGASDGAFHRRFDDAEKWAKEFDKPERDGWQKPEEVIDALHLDRTASVADVGAGTGYFSAKIAKRLPGGKVFAADVEPDMVRYLGERGGRKHIANLLPVQASADAANLPEPVDLILVVDTYHHIGHRIDYFAKLKSSLRPGARLAIIDFRANSPIGPPVEHRIPPEKVGRRTGGGRVHARRKPRLPAEAIFPRVQVRSLGTPANAGNLTNGSFLSQVKRDRKVCVSMYYDPR